MANTAISFEWTRGYGYELSGDVIRQSGRGRDHIHPLEIRKTLYLDFASIDGTAETCLAFAQAWGLLMTPAKLDAAEPIDQWRQKIRSMKSWITGVTMVRTANSRRVEARMAAVDVTLVSGEPWVPGLPAIPKPTLVLRPHTLFDAMMVQLALSTAGGNALATCEQCGNPFEVGATGKRSIARFCSDACRNKFHNQRRVRHANA
jgi:hypothetical protein